MFCNQIDSSILLFLFFFEWSRFGTFKWYIKNDIKNNIKNDIKNDINKKKKRKLVYKTGVFFYVGFTLLLTKHQRTTSVLIKHSPILSTNRSKTSAVLDHHQLELTYNYQLFDRCF